MPAADSLTGLLNAAQAGDSDAAQAAYDLVYAELKCLARNSLRGAAADATLSPTALVHEVFVRLREREAGTLQNRMHFYALAARAMRQILVDHARKRHAEKRGGQVIITDLDNAIGLHGADCSTTIELDAALTSLQERDPDLAQLVEWRFFAGLDFQAIAEESGRSERSLRRDWELARAYLQRRLKATL